LCQIARGEGGSRHGSHEESVVAALILASHGKCSAASSPSRPSAPALLGRRISCRPLDLVCATHHLAATEGTAPFRQSFSCAAKIESQRAAAAGAGSPLGPSPKTIAAVHAICCQLAGRMSGGAHLLADSAASRAPHPVTQQHSRHTNRARKPQSQRRAGIRFCRA
jgi:hypothetical protein